MTLRLLNQEGPEELNLVELIVHRGLKVHALYTDDCLHITDNLKHFSPPEKSFISSLMFSCAWYLEQGNV